MIVVEEIFTNWTYKCHISLSSMYELIHTLWFVGQEIIFCYELRPCSFTLIHHMTINLDLSWHFGHQKINFCYSFCSFSEVCEETANGNAQLYSNFGWFFHFWIHGRILCWAVHSHSKSTVAYSLYYCPKRCVIYLSEWISVPTDVFYL